MLPILASLSVAAVSRTWSVSDKWHRAFHRERIQRHEWSGALAEWTRWRHSLDYFWFFSRWWFRRTAALETVPISASGDPVDQQPFVDD